MSTPPNFPPAGNEPTQAYPGLTPSDAQPTQPYGTPGYAAPQAPLYGQPVPPLGEPAQRPKKLAWAALGSSVLGFVLVLLGFLPLPWVSLALVVIGGILLLVGLILGIVAMASKKQGGTGLGVAALIISVINGVFGFILRPQKKKRR